MLINAESETGTRIGKPQRLSKCCLYLHIYRLKNYLKNKATGTLLLERTSDKLAPALQSVSKCR